VSIALGAVLKFSQDGITYQEVNLGDAKYLILEGLRDAIVSLQDTKNTKVQLAEWEGAEPGAIYFDYIRGKR